MRTLAAEFARRGVRLLAPHVNHSGAACEVKAGAVRIGLGALKHVMARTRTLLLRERPFADVQGLLARVPCSDRELEALILSGACDGLAPLETDAYPFAHEDLLALVKQGRRTGALDGFAPRRGAGPELSTYRRLVRIRNELRFTAMHLTDHPMRVLRQEAARAGCVTTAELATRLDRYARIAGVVAAARRLDTRGGRLMQFVTLEDELGLVEAVLLPGVYASLGDPVSSPGPYLVGGHVAHDHRIDGGDLHLVVADVTPFHLRARPYGRSRTG
jgi:DNA polymerase III alpha subunit